MLPTHPTYTTCPGHHPHLRPGPPSPVTTSAACLPSRYDLFVLEYSEPQLPETTITLSVAGDPLLPRTGFRKLLSQLRVIEAGLRGPSSSPGHRSTSTN